ncbi:hypothetical protein [Sphingomonas sp. CROZ-RG-20F-R02-07]|uniref:hypothetical protein n=1 Tax=Sphingomonas sp. CROZ-RG-20F-R02-07 TaxID=2914832 RepID=UPI001F5AF0C8|nr:hypothetical protein [Sphingomonas sp. CROZ-RG-20F-R02-07]
MLTHDRGHAEFWDYLIGLGAARLRAAGIPMIPLTAEYEEYPRGRVVYDRRQALFVAYADRRVQSAAFRTRVVAEFELEGRRIVWKMDSHYDRSRGIPSRQGG